MRCPFPGMDPYVERPEIWSDFHNSLIFCIRALLQPLLRPRYAAISEERLYVVESERPIHPDVSIVSTSAQSRSTTAIATAVEPDTPLVVELWREEFREPLLHIIEPARGNRLVTSIEVLSPTNKLPGEGREAYLKKQDEVFRAEANLVEIDLLRTGHSTAPISATNLSRLGKYHYLVAVSRYRPPRREFYGCTVQQHLPRVGIPLAGDDRDVVLELQSAFERCWETGPYPELLRYEGPPPGELDESDMAWCRSLLRQAGFGADAAGNPQSAG